MRALVRANLGDRRGGWADAELAARLGRPEWGAAATALIDISMGDARTVRPRRMLAGDPLLRALRIPTECRVSRRPVSTG